MSGLDCGFDLAPRLVKSLHRLISRGVQVKLATEILFQDPEYKCSTSAVSINKHVTKHDN